MAKPRKKVMQDYNERRRRKGITQVKFYASEEFKKQLKDYQAKRGFDSLYATIKYLYKMGAR